MEERSSVNIYHRPDECKIVNCGFILVMQNFERNTSHVFVEHGKHVECNYQNQSYNTMYRTFNKYRTGSKQICSDQP